MNKFVRRALAIADLLLLPFVYPAAFLLKNIRAAGVRHLPLCKRALLQVGVFPIRAHYYEPLFDPRGIRHSLSENRNLPGIDWNVPEQLEILNRFHFGEELNNVPRSKVDRLEFHFNNGTFESGDAEYWYNFIRLKKPRRIFEVGGGNSTLMAICAIKKNRLEAPTYQCRHVCIEPYEMPWLESVGVEVVRRKIEDVGQHFFSELSSGDILFIDSSHIIRPQGDVLFEYLEVLPSLKKGVIVHIHDIFSPRDYLDEWVKEEVRFWNEQYLLEAFLTSNRDWKIVGALNYLHHSHYEKLKRSCPFLTPDREPGSFYIEKTT